MNLKERWSLIKNEIELSMLVVEAGDNVGITARLHREGEEDPRGEVFHTRGYYPEDTIVRQAKMAGSGTRVNIIVTSGDRIVGSVPIINK